LLFSVINQKEIVLNFYEAVFIIGQDASSGHVESVAQEAISVIKSFGGEVAKTEFCGIKLLAYPIKKNKRGHYVLLSLASNSEGIKELERKFKLNEDVIRYLIVKVDRLDNTPSALMRKNFKEATSQEQEKS
jgi:small subunit ribosomal protein S6